MTATHDFTRAALYGRVSTRDKGQEVENQLAQLRQFARHQGWDITQEYTDRASGSTADRDQFQAMFQAASQHEFDVLLFWSLDRLTREGVLPTLQYLTRLSDYGWPGGRSLSSTLTARAYFAMPLSAFWPRLPSRSASVSQKESPPAWNAPAPAVSAWAGRARQLTGSA